MARSIASYLSTVPPTSALQVPTEIQRPTDFPSHRPSASLQDEVTDTLLQEQSLDLSRLHGYELYPLRKKRRSFVWSFGWRLRHIEKRTEHWLCRVCHTGPRKPRRPGGHIFQCTNNTTSAIQHLARQHGITEEGSIPLEPTEPSNQSSIENYGAVTAQPRHVAAGSESFDFGVFKGLLLRLFTTEAIALTKIESPAFKALLNYLRPQLKGSIPSRRSLRRYIATAYDHALQSVESELRGATTRINVSFDLWTSPGRRLALMGVVAHYLDAHYKPRAILLALPRMFGSHTGANLASTLTGLFDHFQLRESFGHAITDNASENAACIHHLSKELEIDAGKRRVLCMGHIINLVAHQLLFGEDVESFEEALQNVTAEEVELRSWRKKGPIGKLHNLIRYILHSTKRRDVFFDLQRRQPQPLQEEAGVALPSEPPKELILDNLTTWNSWYDAAVRAMRLRSAIDHFCDDALGEYNVAMATYQYKWSQSQLQAPNPPQAPSLIYDRLTPDDWHVIGVYVDLLRPCKLATMKLQGQVHATTTDNRPVKGAIWQVLPMFEEIMKGFEDERQRHLPSTSQRSDNHAQQATPPPTQTSPVRRRRTRRSQPQPRATTLANNHQDPPNTEGDIAQEQTADPQPTGAPTEPIPELEHHFTTNINRAWQKLDYYYRKTDETPIHRAAVLLHPRMKWPWFEYYWGMKKGWIDEAKRAIQGLWSEYKDKPTHRAYTTTAAAVPVVQPEAWSSKHACAARPIAALSA